MDDEQKYNELRDAVRMFFETIGDRAMRLADKPIDSATQEEIWTQTLELKRLVSIEKAPEVCGCPAGACSCIAT